MYFVFPIWNMLYLCLLQLLGLEEAQAHQASASSQVCSEQHAFSPLTFIFPTLPWESLPEDLEDTSSVGLSIAVLLLSRILWLSCLDLQALTL